MRFYSGFPNLDTLNVVLKYLNLGNKGQNISYWVSKLNVNVSTAVYEGENEDAMRKTGRPRYVRSIDEFFAVMCRLRQGFAEEHLVHLFQVSLSTVSRIFIIWINFMYLKLGQINIWPHERLLMRPCLKILNINTAPLESSLIALRSDAKCPVVYT